MAGRKAGRRARTWGAMAVAAFAAVACGTGPGSATVVLMNDFDNPAAAVQPPWTICQASYLEVEFGEIALGAQSAALTVEPGLDHVLMVAAWADPDCNPENCLPLASKVEEEVVDGQTRTITLGLTNHQGPCPPEGVQPIPEAVYERIRGRWPSYGFEPYATRTLNPECLD